MDSVDEEFFELYKFVFIHRTFIDRNELTYKCSKT